MQQAAEIRAAEDAKYRRRFDALPAAVQRTLFVPEGAGTGRDRAKAMREEGNALYHAGAHVDALELFEGALRHVWFVTPNSGAPSFRASGIRDEWLTITCVDKEETCLCLLNAALCLSQLKQWDEAIAMCQCALVHATTKELQAKALFRAATAKQRRNKGNDDEEAIGDLSRALQLDGLGGKVKNALDQARSKRLLHLAEEKHMFSGVLHEGDLYEPEPNEQQIKEAAEFGLDLHNPQIRRALRHMAKLRPGTVEEAVHEKRMDEKWTVFRQTCLVVFVSIVLVLGASHLLMRNAALSAKRLPQEYYDWPPVDVNIDEL